MYPLLNIYFTVFLLCEIFLSEFAKGFVVVNLPITTKPTTTFDAGRFTSRKGNNGWKESSLYASLKDKVKYLGRGKDAIVREGAVLLAPAEEFHHFLREAAVFIYGMGYDEHDVYVIRGVIIDHPTPFTMDEVLEQKRESPSSPVTELLQKPIYRGGEVGRENTAIMFHADPELAKAANNDMIGSSGVYQGGLEYTLANDGTIIHDGSSASLLDPSKFKFFFNFMEFTEQELENMLEDPQEDGDAWVSLEIPPEIILNSDWGRGEAWALLRNTVRSMAEERS